MQVRGPRLQAISKASTSAAGPLTRQRKASRSLRSTRRPSERRAALARAKRSNASGSSRPRNARRTEARSTTVTAAEIRLTSPLLKLRASASTDRSSTAHRLFRRKCTRPARPNSSAMTLLVLRFAQFTLYKFLGIGNTELSSLAYRAAESALFPFPPHGFFPPPAPSRLPHCANLRPARPWHEDCDFERMSRAARFESAVHSRSQRGIR